MARVSIKSICNELMPEFKTMAYIQKRLAKKLGKEVDETTVRAQANRLVREEAIDHAKAAKKYGIRGPKVEEGATKPSKKSKIVEFTKDDAPVKARRKVKVTKEGKKAEAKTGKDGKPAKSSKKKSDKVTKASAKKSGKEGKPSKKAKTLRRSKK